MLKGLLAIIIIQAAMPVIGFCKAQPKAADSKPTLSPNPTQDPEYKEIIISIKNKINKYFITLKKICMLEIVIFLLAFFNKPFFILSIMKLKIKNIIASIINVNKKLKILSNEILIICSKSIIVSP
jgi:hypothetical protein